MSKQVFLPEPKKKETPEIEGAIFKVKSAKKKQIENMLATRKKNVVNVIRDWLDSDKTEEGTKKKR